MRQAVLIITFLSLSVLANAKTDKLFDFKWNKPAQTTKPVAAKKPVKKVVQAPKTISYKIISTNDLERGVKAGELMMIHLYGTAKLENNKDTLLISSYVNGKAFVIPANEPTLGKVFLKLRKNDSLEMDVFTDSLFKNSFGQATPKMLKKNSYMHFIAKVENVFSQQELRELQESERAKNSIRDSLALAEFLLNYKDVKTTSTGLKYIITKSATGNMPQKGDEVKMLYTGLFLDGKKFDENLNTENPFSFTLGVGQVIAGWDEGILLLHEGEEAKLIIPSNLGYGEKGTGPIPPNATLVFDVKLLKINAANK